MSARFHTIGLSGDPTSRAMGAPLSPAKPLSYEMKVFATGVDDAVRAAGGWLCDRIRAGWHVTVVLPTDADPRPMQILGIRMWTTEDFATLVNATSPAAVAMSTGAVSDDIRVLKLIDRALDRKSMEVTMWGDEMPLAAVGRLGDVRHRMSSAAWAFKSEALAAVDGTDRDSRSAVEDRFVERFYGHAPW